MDKLTKNIAKLSAGRQDRQLTCTKHEFPSCPLCIVAAENTRLEAEIYNRFGQDKSEIVTMLRQISCNHKDHACPLCVRKRLTEYFMELENDVLEIGVKNALGQEAADYITYVREDFCEHGDTSCCYCVRKAILECFERYN